MSLASLSYRHVVFLCASVLAFLLISFITPPMQSPDEGAHFKRSYLLTDGVIVMGHEGDLRSGGRIDSELDDFIHEANKTKAGKAKSIIDELKEKTWSGVGKYSIAYNTAYNFPIIYLPQSVTVALGEAIDAKIINTYYTARIVTFLTTMSILLFAWSIYRIPTSVIVLLILPMSMFQLSSAVLDSITISLTVLIMSIFARSRNSEISDKLFIALILCCFIVSTSKANMLPICALPFITKVNVRKSIKFILSLLPIVMSLAWIVVALSNTNDAGVHHPGYSQGDLIKFYVTHPFHAMSVLFNTITDGNIVDFYYKSFVGILGPLDVYLRNGHYTTLGILFLISIIICHAAKKNIVINWWSILIGLSCLGLVFCALLVQWSKFPTQVIEGIQGRYFICPVIILLFSLRETNIGRMLNGKLTIPVIFSLSLYFSVTALIGYYY